MLCRYLSLHRHFWQNLNHRGAENNAMKRALLKEKTEVNWTCPVDPSQMYVSLFWSRVKRMERHQHYHINTAFLCCCSVAKSCSTLLQPHGLWTARLPCPWNFPGKNTGMSCHFLLQGIFPAQGSKLEAPAALLYCRQILYHWAKWETQGRYLLILSPCM